MLKRLALALTCSASLWATNASAEPKFVYSSSISLSEGGGLSGLELSKDGRSGITVSDRGAVYEIALERIDGKLTKAQLTPWAITPKIKGDVEGIATLEKGSYFFSMEKPAKVISVNGAGKMQKLPDHPDFAKMGRNSQLEALAIDANGTLYTLPEITGGAKQGFPLYAFKNAKWELITHIPERGTFLAVGADFGPDNLFYLLERSVSLLGFRTRVRRFDLSQPDLGEETLIKTGQLSHDNLEGISVWQDETGAMRITMISDDNFAPILRNEIVEYVLQE